MWSKALNQESTEPDGVHGRSSLLPAFPGALEAIGQMGTAVGFRRALAVLLGAGKLQRVRPRQ